MSDCDKTVFRIDGTGDTIHCIEKIFGHSLARRRHGMYTTFSL